MALILVKELNGKGNAHADGTPVARDRQGKPRESGEALILATAKASGMVFHPWEIVQVPGGERQQQSILSHIAEHWPNNPPIKAWSWNDKEMVAEYMRRHPDKQPKAEAGTDEYLLQIAELVSQTADPESTPIRYIKNGQDINSARPAVRDYRKKKTAPQSSPAPETVEAKSDNQEFAESRFKEMYNKHIENGKSDKQATFYATKAYDSALKKGDKG
tara:strand:- start:18885 stop:19535 length:651 start_codon:yes stop_codon:yes gene_type:complete